MCNIFERKFPMYECRYSIKESMKAQRKQWHRKDNRKGQLAIWRAFFTSPYQINNAQTQ